MTTASAGPSAEIQALLFADAGVLASLLATGAAYVVATWTSRDELSE